MIKFANFVPPIFRFFSNRIVLDMHPSTVKFTCFKKDITFSLDPIIQINNHDRSLPMAIGECISDVELQANEYYRAHLSDIHCINIFDMDKPLPPRTNLSREKIIQIFLEYGFIKTDQSKYLPSIKPLVFILGADHFNHLFKNPKETLKRLSINAGAARVYFDKTDL